MEFRIFATIILITIQIVLSTARPQSLDPQVDADLLSSIAEIQKKFSENKNDEETESITNENRRIDENVQNDDLTLSESQNSVASEKNRQTKAYPAPLGESKLKAEGSFRRDKMLGGYFGYYPQALGAIPNPYFQMPAEYFDDYAAAMEGMDAEEILGRGAGRRRPQNGMTGYQQNSPIYYIRLPPTPYMFVPGLGYISQPPTIQPMNQIAPMNPHQINHPMTQMNQIPQYSTPTVSPMNMNPFINVPVNFLANGKPTNIYQWAGAPQYQQPQYQSPHYPQFAPNPYPMGYPQQRPQRPPPQFRPKPSLQQDSKITHLKGQYLFNGRPEQIYLLPNTPYHNSINPYPLSYY